MIFILGFVVFVTFILGLFVANRNEKRWMHMGLIVGAFLLVALGIIYWAVRYGMHP